MLIDFYSLGVIELLRLLTINCMTYPAGNPYLGGLQLQALAGNLSIARDISQKITFQKHS